MVISHFWSYVLIILLELLKAAAILISFAALAEARNRIIILRLSKGKRVPRIFYFSDIWGPPENHCKLIDLKNRDKKKDSPVYPLFFAADGIFVYAVIQFAGTRDNMLSLSKLILTVVALLFFGIFACVGDDAPGWHYNVMLVLLIATIGGYIACMVHAGDYYDNAYAPWSYNEKQIISEERIELEELHFELDSKGKLLVVANGTPYFSGMERHAGIQLIADDEAYVTRSEYNRYLLVANSRFGYVLTAQKARRVDYEVHYVGSPELVLPLEGILN